MVAISAISLNFLHIYLPKRYRFLTLKNESGDKVWVSLKNEAGRDGGIILLDG